MQPLSEPLQVAVTQAPHPEVKGQAEPCSETVGLIYSYSTNQNEGNIYVWKVIGGNLVTLQGKPQVMATWTGPGSGYIMVTETSPNGCSTTDTLEVTIFDCTAIPENQPGKLLVYPNPVEDKLIVEAEIGESGMVMLNIYNSNGQAVIREKVLTDNGKVKVTLSTAALPAGAYNLQMVTPRFVVLEGKFLKAK